MKKVLVYGLTAAFLCFGAYGVTMAETNKGPESITMEPNVEKAKKTAVIFPHKGHQDAGITCGECHHGVAEDGSQAPYADGQEIVKCAECHNAEKLAGKMAGKLKLDTLKGAAHGNCLVCHKAEAKKDPAKKELKKCSTCHPKK